MGKMYKSFCDSLKTKIGDGSKLLILIVIIEASCLAFMLGKGLIAPATEKNYSINEFDYGGLSNVHIDSDSIVFCQDESISKEHTQIVTGSVFGMPSGAYDFSVHYESITDGKGDRSKSSGQITIVSQNHEIETETLTLDDGHNEVHGRFWIPLFSNCDDLRVNIIYNGQGTLRINNVYLREYSKYRVVRLVGLILFFIILDLMFILLFTEYLIKIDKVKISVILISFIASIPFFDDIVYNGHDLWFHMLRIMAVARGLSEGQFPVRIATEVNNGYGYLNSIYYCDIFLYPSACLYKLHLPLRMCYQFYVIMLNFVTSCTTYYAMSGFTNKKSLRILGTMIYMLGAYRLTNLNVRAAAGEFTAMCFLPLIVVGLWNVLKKSDNTTINWFPLAIGMSCVIMSHIVTAEMLVINITLLCFVTAFRFLNIYRIKAMIKAVGASILMTAWFLIPFLDSVKSQTTLVQKSDLRMLGDTTQQWSKLFEIIGPGHDVGNYLSLGIAMLAAIVVMVYSLLNYKITYKCGRCEAEQVKFFRIVCLFSFFNILLVSKIFPWNRIQNWFGLDGLGYQIGTIQFAWRFLSIASILVSVGLVCAMDFIYNNEPKFFIPLCAVLITSIILGSGMFYFQYFDYSGVGKWNNVSEYTGTDNLYYLAGTDASIINISKCQVVEGSATVDLYKKNKGIAYLHVKNNLNEQISKITVPIFAYDHYHVNEIKGNTVGEEIKCEVAENKCILIDVPAGYDGDMMVYFKEPVSWKASEIISLAAWLVIFYKVICEHILFYGSKKIRTE